MIGLKRAMTTCRVAGQEPPKPNWRDRVSEDEIRRAGDAVSRLSDEDRDAVLKMFDVAEKEPLLWQLIYPAFRALAYGIGRDGP